MSRFIAFLSHKYLLIALAIIIAGAISGELLASLDLFEWLYQYSRAHEDWELDEWIVVSVATLIIGLIVSVGLAIGQARAARDLNHRLEREKRALELASTAKSRFLSSVSHELRTPLNQVTGFAQLIRSECNEDTDYEKIAVYAREVVDGAQTILVVIDRMIEYASLENAVRNSRFVPVYVSDVVEAAMDVFGPRMGSEANRVDIRLGPAAGIRWWCDSDLAIRSLYEIIDNALRHNADDVEIRIIGGVSGDRSSAWIDICDTGTGIPQGQRHNLFEPFERLHQTGGSISGIGLGLAVSRRYAQSMRGDLAFYAPVSGGACFRLSLPIAKVAGASPESSGAAGA